MHLVQRLMRLFFNLLYHTFAFTYDLVAALVSLGRWNDWVASVIPFIHGPRVLELGFGPGHLLTALQGMELIVIGLDESRQMVRITRRRLLAKGYPESRLLRGHAGCLPIISGSIDTIVSTFPSEYIFDPTTLAEIDRVLVDQGRLIVLPVAWHVGRGVLERLLAWIFRATGESPGPFEAISRELKSRIEKAGFHVEIHKLRVGSSLLLLLVGRKRS